MLLLFSFIIYSGWLALVLLQLQLPMVWLSELRIGVLRGGEEKPEPKAWPDKRRLTRHMADDGRRILDGNFGIGWEDFTFGSVRVGSVSRFMMI